MKNINKRHFACSLLFLLPFLFGYTTVMAQMREAKEILGKEYNPVYDKYKYLSGIEHQIATQNGVISKVTVSINLPRTKTIDFINESIGYYWRNSDSIFHDVVLTEEFSYEDLFYNPKGIAELYVYSGQYIYTFTHNKTNNELKIIHQLNQTKLHLNINSDALFFKVTKYLFNNKQVLDNEKLNKSDMALVFYMNTDGSSFFANYRRGEGSYSKGKVTDREVEKSVEKNAKETTKNTTYTFTWNYSNSYNDHTGEANVVFKTIESETQIKFVCKIYIWSTDESFYFEGYKEK